MKETLLAIVQEILSDMDSDDVNSIDDTEEAGQVATIVKSTYFAMIANRNWPHTRRGLQVGAFSDPLTPTHMKLQDAVKELCFINYDSQKLGATRKDYQKIRYLQPDEFLRRANQEDDSLATVQLVTDPSGISFSVRNDRAPRFYTSFNDEDLVFDAFDSEVDSSLQESKVQAQAYVIPTWTATDSFVPDLPDEAFPSLIEEAKSKAMFKLKQMVDRKAEQESDRQRRWLARKARRVSGGIQYPDYGRSSRKIRRDVTFERDR